MEFKILLVLFKKVFETRQTTFVFFLSGIIILVKQSDVKAALAVREKYSQHLHAIGSFDFDTRYESGYYGKVGQK